MSTVRTGQLNVDTSTMTNSATHRRQPHCCPTSDPRARTLFRTTTANVEKRIFPNRDITRDGGHETSMRSKVRRVTVNHKHVTTTRKQLQPITQHDTSKTWSRCLAVVSNTSVTCFAGAMNGRRELRNAQQAKSTRNDKVQTTDLPELWQPPQFKW